jgi:hypothetical protein
MSRRGVEQAGVGNHNYGGNCTKTAASQLLEGWGGVGGGVGAGVEIHGGQVGWSE